MPCCFVKRFLKLFTVVIIRIIKNKQVKPYDHKGQEVLAVQWIREYYETGTKCFIHITRNAMHHKYCCMNPKMMYKNCPAPAEPSMVSRFQTHKATIASR